MVFNSYRFIFWFFPIFYISWRCFRFNNQIRWVTLLIMSYLFYAWWDYRFTGLILYTTCVNYYAGHLIHVSSADRIKKSALWGAVFLSLLPLFLFKYLPWLGGYASYFMANDSKEQYVSFLSSIILPIGISFFTFQAMSYVIDLYNQKCNYCKSLLKFATFVSMFPQLLAGPITRYRYMDEQLQNTVGIDQEADLPGGMELFFIGLIKKVLFADRIGTLINPAFAAGAELSIEFAWLSILGYTLQIYFDFSGYSDMATGIARCLGFKLPINFLAPYTSLNPTEFWRRWHISLSTWLRDYVYIPLGGNRGSKWFNMRNLFLTMVIGGVWHGAAWTFIFWGMWHGLLLVIHRLTPQHIKASLPKAISITMLNAGVIIGWVFFRSPTISDAFSFISALIGVGVVSSCFVPWAIYFLVPLGYLFHWYERKLIDNPGRPRMVYALSLALTSAWAILELGKDTPFIYFQF